MSSAKTVLFVRGFSLDVRARDLAAEFEKIGELVRCDLPIPKTPGSNPFAFVEYKDPRDAQDAFDRLHNKDVGGSALIIEWAKAPKVGRRYDDRGGTVAMTATVVMTVTATVDATTVTIVVTATVVARARALPAETVTATTPDDRRDRDRDDRRDRDRDDRRDRDRDDRRDDRGSRDRVVERSDDRHNRDDRRRGSGDASPTAAPASARRDDSPEKPRRASSSHSDVDDDRN
ncbi:hypothetical protein BC831DRAFT_456273 [Entophlyctis helioformis]|nr:hypothetical protein BC831DRAFT_456273 [Entophlyctis helioformis]